MYNERNVSPTFKRPDLTKTQRLSAPELHNKPKIELNQDQRRLARKPSPGVAARFKALGFGKESIKPDIRAHYNDKIGRIPEDQISNLDKRHRANSAISSISREGGRGGSPLYVKRNTPDGSSEETTVIDSSLLESSTRQQGAAVVSETLYSMVPTEEVALVSQISKSTFHSGSHATNEHLNTLNTQTEKRNSINQNSPFISKEMLSDTINSGQKVPEDLPGFNPFGLQRSGSIYTISRASFTSQLAQLTSLQLPDAETLYTKISEIPTAKVASKALARAAEQILSWISQAFEVIAGLIGEDDVEWAAAGGREGLAEVDKAITRFEKLIKAYVSAIELLQSRTDIHEISGEEHNKMISQVDIILAEWAKIKNTLKEVKNSVEIAMEWEELWDNVLGDIGIELNTLRKLVFEMEEKRHKSAMRDGGDAIGFVELETIEETPPHKIHSKTSRSTSYAFSPITQSFPEQNEACYDDTKLLALFARMQPLRASLDFFPMRLSAFLSRVGKMFPTACRELETRFMELELDWKSLEKDAESLRKELGEDRWVLVFKVAGQQAQKMYDSVERSFIKFQEVVDRDTCIENSVSLSKRYEKKKEYYGPAIEKVLSIIDKGIKNRLTVNGEILRLHWDTQHKWDTLKYRMNKLDKTLAKIQAGKINEQSGELITKVNHNSHNTIGCLHGTPGSSPASSIITTSQNSNQDLATPGKPKSRNINKLSQACGRRTSSLPISTNRYRRSMSGSLSTAATSFGSYSSPKQGCVTPMANNVSNISQLSSSDGKPRWNNSTKVQDGSIGHVYKSNSYATPSPQSLSKRSVNNFNRLSAETKTLAHPLLGRGDESLNATDITLSHNSHSRLSFRDRLSERIFTPGRSSQQAPIKTSPNQPRLHNQISLSALHASSKDKVKTVKADVTDSTPSKSIRSVTSLGTNLRMSFLPIPKPRHISSSAINPSRVPSVGNCTNRSIERKPFRA